MFDLFSPLLVNPPDGLHETRRAFWFKCELINIQTQIHWNENFCPIFVLLLCLFSLLSLNLSSDYSSPVSSLSQQLCSTWFKRFHEKYSFLSCCKFILRECASYDGRFDSNKNKRVKKKFEIEWVHTHELQTKDLKSHCIGHKNCWLTLYIFPLLFCFSFIFMFLFLTRTVFLCVLYTLITWKMWNSTMVMHWKYQAVSVPCHVTHLAKEVN